MTTKQSEVLTFIKQYIKTHKVAPTFREIAEAIGVSALSTVHKHVERLKFEGRITASGNQKQSIKVVAEPADTGRFEFEGPHHLWDKKLNCYWVKEKAK